MNIFEIYREQIINLIKTLNKKNVLQLPENLKGVNTDIPPAKFDGDLSSNVAMILSKHNQKQPEDIANTIAFVLNFSAYGCPTEIMIRPQKTQS